MVVAVKEKTRIQPTHPKFVLGPRKPSSSSVSSISLSGSPPNSPTGSPTQPPPANSPTAGFNHPNANPQLSTHRGSDFDISRTLSSASLALTKATTSKADGQLRPKSAIRNKDIFRGEASSSSDDADADDEKDGDEESEQGSWESADNDDGGNFTEESDKENQPSSADNNNDAARLHEEFRMVTIGSKRQRGEGTEELEDGEIEEEDKPVINMDVGKKKKKTSPARTSSMHSNLANQGQGQTVGGQKEQQAIKRVKLLETPSTTGKAESARQARNEKSIVMMMTMDDTADVAV